MRGAFPEVDAALVCDADVAAEYCVTWHSVGKLYTAERYDLQVGKGGNLNQRLKGNQRVEQQGLFSACICNVDTILRVNRRVLRQSRRF